MKWFYFNLIWFGPVEQKQHRSKMSVCEKSQTGDLRPTTHQTWVIFKVSESCLLKLEKKKENHLLTKLPQLHHNHSQDP